MEQTGTLRQLAGARSLSSFIRNGDSGQTDPCFPSLTGVRGKDYGVDLPVAAYVTAPRSFARQSMICSPPTLRTIGNSPGGLGCMLGRQWLVRSALIEFRKVFGDSENTGLAIEVDSVGRVGCKLDLARLCSKPGDLVSHGDSLP
jgi:hypothetical protein